MERFNNRLKELAELKFLSESLESMDEFAAFYERMLAQALVRQDQGTAAAMRKILVKQIDFLITERAKAENNNDDTANHQ